MTPSLADPAPPVPPDWHALPPDEARHRLGVGATGLSLAEVAARRRESGLNRFVALRPTPLLTILLRQFKSILVLLLIGAAAISFATGDQRDAWAILAVLALNAAVGFATEWRARRAMEGLLALEVNRAWVQREGQLLDLPAEELVPGDLITIEAGQAVPADARLCAAADLQTVEAALTGESAPVEKDATAVLARDAPLPERRTMIYRATTVTAGRGQAVVVATGMRTEVGRIGELTARVGSEQTPLERRLEQLGRPLALAAVLTSALALVAAAVQGTPLLLARQTAIALAVAAVPEGLPAVATITLALGVRRMARQQALIRRLPAVETLGSTTVICSDKTGTLTTGVMTLSALRLAEREYTLPADASAFHHAGAPVTLASEPRLLAALRIGALANRAEARPAAGGWTTLGDPTEAALLVAAHRAGLDPATFRAEWPEIGELLFSSERMLMATYHQGPEGLTGCVKGAPARVLDRCSQLATASGPLPLTPALREELLAANRALAARGLRVLALAEGPVGAATPESLRELCFVAFAAISDPPAAGVRETIARFRSAGIRTIMITGDQEATALAVAASLELGAGHPQALGGAELDRLDEAGLTEAVRRISVYTRVSPEAKVRLVRALQQAGEVVAMLGDGVNDAAALRTADIGVAMGRRGSDLAKEAAEIVLADDRFATIGVAVEQGRLIHDNVRKAVLYLLACNVAELAVVLIAAAAGWPAPLTPLQILWLNLLTDVLPALALALEPGEANLMHRPPQPPGAPLVSRRELGIALGYAAGIAAATLGAYSWARGAGLPPGEPMAIAFLTLAFAQVLHLGNARQRRHVSSWRRAIANPAALAAVGVTAALLLLTTAWPPLANLLGLHRPSLLEWGVVLGLAAVPALLGQFMKLRRR
ncbi:MAG: cation-translocating P-type ATPase [Gemmatimonadetes bacterium]|nr:cation-translocating P-type ATPase [Gemmatimonadota bacterium]